MNLKHLCEALIAALAHERFQVPPIDPVYDLDTAATLLGMSRRKLMEYLRQQQGRYRYKVNAFTNQRFLVGKDIQDIREALITDEPADYDARAKNLPSVQRRLSGAGLAGGGDLEGGIGGDAEEGV